MNCTRVYTDDQGETHFEDITIHLTARSAGALDVSEAKATQSLVFFEAPQEWDYSWHPAPDRRYAIIVSGALELEVSDGEVRKCEAGDVLLLEDTSGKGHYTRALAGSKAGGIFIHLPE